MDVHGPDPARREIVCTSTGYHPLTRRKVGLSLAGLFAGLAVIRHFAS